MYPPQNLSVLIYLFFGFRFVFKVSVHTYPPKHISLLGISPSFLEHIAVLVTSMLEYCCCCRPIHDHVACIQCSAADACMRIH